MLFFGVPGVADIGAGTRGKYPSPIGKNLTLTLSFAHQQCDMNVSFFLNWLAPDNDERYAEGHVDLIQ